MVLRVGRAYEESEKSGALTVMDVGIWMLCGVRQ